MRTINHRLLAYLEVLSGERPDLGTRTDSTLPLFLRERYATFSTRLFGRKYVLAVENEDWKNGSPGEYGKHAAVLQLKLGEPVIMVIRVLPSYARNRMVQMGIAFVVPGSQTFIPNSLIDLRERFPQPNSRNLRTLSPAAQCTVLSHLLGGSLDGKSLKEIAQKVRYSPMMLSKVKDELETVGVCNIVRRGRSVILDFVATGRSLWDRVQSQLTSPVNKVRWIQWDRPGATALIGGMSALSRRTMIGDDRLPTYAMPHTGLQVLLERGLCEVCPDGEDATARVEVWAYPPERLGGDGLVDPLSLYLSLRDSPDERVQQQLGELIEGVKW